MLRAMRELMIGAGSLLPLICRPEPRHAPVTPQDACLRASEIPLWDQVGRDLEHALTNTGHAPKEKPTNPDS